MADYSVIIVSRTPLEEGDNPGATFVELGPVVDPSNLTWTNKLNREQELSFACDPTKLQDDIKTRLRDLYNHPCEVWVYRDDELVFVGPLVAYTASGNLLKIQAKGLLYYFRYLDTRWMGYSDGWAWVEDKYDQIRRLVRELYTNWQYYSVFHGIQHDLFNPDRELHGETMTVVWGDNQEKTAYDLIIDIAEQGGFDFDIDLKTRRFLFWSPRGSDLSNTVFMDSRNIDEYEVFVSVGAEDVANTIHVWGKSQTARYSVMEGAPDPENFGTVHRGVTVDHDQNLDVIAQTYHDAHAKQLVRPGGSFLPVVGAGPTDFDVGDSITFSYDFGLGPFTGVYRVVTKKVDVDDLGQESISVEFE